MLVIWDANRALTTTQKRPGHLDRALFPVPVPYSLFPVPCSLFRRSNPEPGCLGAVLRCSSPLNGALSVLGSPFQRSLWLLASPVHGAPLGLPRPLHGETLGFASALLGGSRDFH